MKNLTFFYALVSVSLISWASASVGQNKKISLFDDSSVSLGSGYQISRSEYTAPCVGGTMSESGQYLTQSYLNKPLSAEELTSILYLNQEPAIEKSYRTNLLARINNFDSISQSKSMNLWYLVRIAGRKQNLSPSGLASKLSNTITEGTPQTRYQACGSHFIQELELGGYVIINVRLTFDHFEHARTIERDSNLNQAPFQVLIERIRTLNDDYQGKLQIGINATQVGGTPQKLFDVFSGGGSRLFCTLDNLASCADLVAKLQDYITHPTQFPAQIRDAPSDPTHHQGATPISATLMHYVDAGIPKLDSSTWEATLMPLLTARRNSFQILMKVKSHQREISEYLALGLQESESERLRSLAQILESNRAQADRTVQGCFDELASCDRAKSSFQANYKVYSDSEVRRDKQYVDYCLSTFNSLEDVRSLEAVKDQLPQHLTCSLQHKALTEKTRLDLRRRQLRELNILRDATSLQEILLQDNQIDSLSILGKLPELRKLQLARNKLKDVDLSGWGHLEKINLDENEITSLVGWQRVNPQEFSMIDNPLSSSMDLRRALASRVPALYLDDNDICKAERLRLFRSSAINEDLYLTFEAMNFIPENQKLDPRNTDNWVLCSFAFQSIPRY